MSLPSARVQDELNRLGLKCQVVEFSDSTRTAADAAATIGCEVAQIAKSLVFRGTQSGEAILIIASGTNRVNEATIAETLGETITRADADFVRGRTGFAIGGVPPLGHLTPLRTLIDSDLFGFEVVWAAAGTPRSVFKLNRADLLKLQQHLTATTCKIT